MSYVLTFIVYLYTHISVLAVLYYYCCWISVNNAACIALNVEYRFHSVIILSLAEHRKQETHLVMKPTKSEMFQKPYQKIKATFLISGDTFDGLNFQCDFTNKTHNVAVTHFHALWLQLRVLHNC